MQPVYRPDQVAEIDRLALEHTSIEAILDRVGWVIASEAISMLGGRYGRRVTVLAGPGLNGADGRSAAVHLERQGVRATVVDALDLPEQLPPADLVIDAAFGIGANRPWAAPDVGRTPVLAVDVPSAIDSRTGEALGEPLIATRTVALMGVKPGLLLGHGSVAAGEVVIRDIGLSGPTEWSHVEDVDVATMVPARPTDSHKWRSAVLVLAGSPGMTGAAALTARAAMRAGSGYVHLDTPAPAVADLPVEAVASFAGGGNRPDPDRFSAAVVGPGIGRAPGAAEFVRTACTSLDVPLVIDGDGLSAIADAPDLLHDREAAAVLTPHDGEFARLTGDAPGPDRPTAALELSRARKATVLVKGPTSLVAAPDGRLAFVTSGDQRLATAGSGDVLSGIIGAFLARGATAFDAAAAAAHVHGLAGRRSGIGTVASDLVDQLPEVLADLGVQ